MHGETIKIVVYPFRRKPRWRSLIISSAYGANFDSRILDKVLDAVGERYMAL